VTALAHLVQKGKKLHVWNVEINNSAGELISLVSVTNYVVSPKNK
jgi:acyl-coenzyme A thioesterase PaaI-like protein